MYTHFLIYVYTSVDIYIYILLFIYTSLTLSKAHPKQRRVGTLIRVALGLLEARPSPWRVLGVGLGRAALGVWGLVCVCVCARV